MKYEGGKKLNVMNRQTFADANVMEQIFKCQPAASCCWNTSRRLSASRCILNPPPLLSLQCDCSTTHCL